MILTLFLILFLFSTKSVSAQIPLFHQLISAYQPRPIKTPSPIYTYLATPSSKKPINQSSTPNQTAPTQPAIGGNGQLISLAVFGDSMIETLGPDLPTLTSTLQKQYPALAIKILSHGYPSTNLESALVHLPEILIQKPNILVVESFAYNNFGNSQTGLEKHSQLLSQIVDTVRLQSPDTKIILTATIAPNSVIFANNSQNFSALDKLEKSKTIKLYLENMIKFAQKNNLPLANVYQASLNQAGEGMTELINSTDNIHPSPKGQQLFETILAKSILSHNLLTP